MAILLIDGLTTPFLHICHAELRGLSLVQLQGVPFMNSIVFILRQAAALFGVFKLVYMSYKSPMETTKTKCAWLYNKNTRELARWLSGC